MSDNIAILQGYTREVCLESDRHVLCLLVKPDVDLDTRFKAWDTDEQEWLMVNGWMFVEVA